jgi:hypothetical protein
MAEVNDRPKGKNVPSLVTLPWWQVGFYGIPVNADLPSLAGKKFSLFLLARLDNNKQPL